MAGRGAGILTADFMRGGGAQNRRQHAGATDALLLFGFDFVGLAGRPAGFWLIDGTMGKILKGRSVCRRTLRVPGGKSWRGGAARATKRLAFADCLPGA